MSITYTIVSFGDTVVVLLANVNVSYGQVQVLFLYFDLKSWKGTVPCSMGKTLKAAVENKFF